MNDRSGVLKVRDKRLLKRAAEKIRALVQTACNLVSAPGAECGVDLIEVCSGVARLTPFAKSKELTTGSPVDQRANTPLDQVEGQERVNKTMEESQPYAVYFRPSFACNNKDEAPTGLGEHPAVKWMVQRCERQAIEGRAFVVEQKAGSPLFKVPEVKRLLRLRGCRLITLYPGRRGHG